MAGNDLWKYCEAKEAEDVLRSFHLLEGTGVVMRNIWLVFMQSVITQKSITILQLYKKRTAG